MANKILINVSPVTVEATLFKATITVSILQDSLTLPSSIEILYESLDNCWGMSNGDYRFKKQDCEGYTLANLEETIQSILKNTKESWTEYEFYCQSHPLLPGERVIAL
jgi:hypothetical protein